MRDLKIPEKARKPDNAQPKKPSWICVRAPGGQAYDDTKKIMRKTARRKASNIG